MFSLQRVLFGRTNQVAINKWSFFQTLKGHGCFVLLENFWFNRKKADIKNLFVLF